MLGRLNRLALGGLLVVAGCASGPASQSATGQGGSARERTQQTSIRLLGRIPCVTGVAEWARPDYLGEADGSGLEITSFHYRIFTTLQDPLILRQAPVLLESAYQAFGEFISEPLASHEKLLVYLFESRQEWEAFTRRWMGRQASVYLKIRSGAYYAKGACVAYHISRQADFAVLAHECWHQFTDAFFAYHLPAWLDEGLATNFEAYRWRNGRVEFSPRYNAGRVVALRAALVHGKMIELSELLSLDAGRVVAHGASEAGEGQGPDGVVSSYYAQVYALVRFFREEGNGRRLYAFKKLLTDGALGRWVLPADLRDEGLHHDRKPSRRWNAMVGRLIARSYLAADPAELQRAYHAFCRKIVAEAHLKKTF